MSAISRPAFGLRMGVTPKAGKQMQAGKSSSTAAGRDHAKVGPAGAGRVKQRPKK